MRVLFGLDKKDYQENDERYFRPSVRGIILKNDRLAMVHSLKYDYYKFPGGGMEPGESYISTLIREVQEETGLSVVPSSIKEYGLVQRIQKGKKAGTVFVQDNFYFFCEATDDMSVQKLDDYESEEHFTLEYVTPETVVETNRFADHREKNEDEFYLLMIERDAKVAELLMKEKLFL